MKMTPAQSTPTPVQTQGRRVQRHAWSLGSKIARVALVLVALNAWMMSRLNWDIYVFVGSGAQSVHVSSTIAIVLGMGFAITLASTLALWRATPRCDTYCRALKPERGWIDAVILVLFSCVLVALWLLVK